MTEAEKLARFRKGDWVMDDVGSTGEVTYVGPTGLIRVEYSLHQVEDYDINEQLELTKTEAPSE